MFLFEFPIPDWRTDAHSHYAPSLHVVPVSALSDPFYPWPDKSCERGLVRFSSHAREIIGRARDGKKLDLPRARARRGFPSSSISRDCPLDSVAKSHVRPRRSPTVLSDHLRHPSLPSVISSGTCSDDTTLCVSLDNVWKVVRVTVITDSHGVRRHMPILCT